MSDLNYIDKTLEVKIAGQDATGNGVNYVSADANGNALVKDYADGPVSPGSAASVSTLVGGQYNSTLPSPTNTQQSAIQLDYKSRLIVAPASFSYFHPVYTLRRQIASNSNSNNTTTLATTISTTQSGSLIVVIATSTNGTLTCTDSASQTYTSAVLGISGNDHHYIFYKANSVAGVTSVTITDGTAVALNMVVSEYTNITSTPLDKTSTNSAGPATSFTSNATTTTAQANELLIGTAYDIQKNSTTFVAGTGWVSAATIANGAGAGGTLFQEDQYVMSTGSYAATGTLSQSDNYIANIATFDVSSYPSNFTIPGVPVTIKSGAGTLTNIAINALGSIGSTVTLYDNTTNSGSIIATVSLSTSIGTIPYNLHFTNGLTIVVNSTTADFTIVYD